ncbi:hypothetical protein IEQ34_018261 [Dendrobium chrysotoxum]|uniref:Uncharacterized protein n=1 Tax=Dendrobium chrysotoxum TaxID=161865 RepID=A0AAV7GDS4_DENCH|nr:hypothetical protein IEQ34_018261 [Dendrobium chrysotoxum]
MNNDVYLVDGEGTNKMVELRDNIAIQLYNCSRYLIYIHKLMKDALILIFFLYIQSLLMKYGGQHVQNHAEY